MRVLAPDIVEAILEGRHTHPLSVWENPRKTRE
jgi:hypothetical protein